MGSNFYDICGRKIWKIYFTVSFSLGVEMLSVPKPGIDSKINKSLKLRSDNGR